MASASGKFACSVCCAVGAVLVVVFAVACGEVGVSAQDAGSSAAGRGGNAGSGEPPTLTTSPRNDWQVGDLTGDGKADLVTWDRGGQPVIRVAPSTGSGFGAERDWGIETCSTCIREVADVNGDGKEDVISFAWGETEQPGWADVSVHLSNGDSLGPRQLWHSSFCIREQVCHVADVNGDGKADLVAFTPLAGPVWVSLSDGARFGDNAVWHEYFCVVSEQCRVGDVNGDGKADLIAFKPEDGEEIERGNVLVSFSSGGGFGQAQLGHGYFCIANEGCLVGDMNGDAKADIFLLKQWGEPHNLQALSSLSDGGRFINDNPMVWSDAITGLLNTGQLADVTGDGKADLVTKDDAADGTSTSPWFFRLYPNSAHGGCIVIRDPVTGCAVVNPEPEPAPPPGAAGYSEIALWNCHDDPGAPRSVTVYVGGSVTTLDPQYNSSGACPWDDSGLPAEPERVDLVPGNNEIVVVDPGQVGCEGRNDPNYAACIRRHFVLPGDENGPTFPFGIS